MAAGDQSDGNEKLITLTVFTFTVYFFPAKLICTTLLEKIEGKKKNSLEIE